MAEEEHFLSLFDMASKKEKKKKEEKALGGTSEAAFVQAPLGLDELRAQFERCKEMHQEMKQKIEEAYEKANISPRKLKEYYSTPSNFTDAEWKEVEKERVNFERKMKELLPLGLEQEMKPGELEGESKMKKPKGFASKKRWLSMH